jgi:hypothetical protein
VRARSAARTRWHGTMIGIGVRPTAAAAARRRSGRWMRREGSTLGDRLPARDLLQYAHIAEDFKPCEDIPDLVGQQQFGELTL